jgi:TonB family protein
MTALSTAISRALIHFVWQGSIAGLVLWATLFALRKRSPNSRYAVSCAALALLAFLPIVTTWRLYAQPAAANAGQELLAAFSQVMNTIPAATQSPQRVWLAWMQIWTLPVWSLGVLLFSARLVLGYQHAFRLRRRGTQAGETVTRVVNRLASTIGVRRPIQVLVSSISDTPSVVGWLRPVILLPTATLMGLTPLQLEAVLAHEIGHIRRYDYLVNMLQMLAETLLFYHPAVWWTSRQIRVERELCCDDLAVRFSGNALRYARALTTLEKLRLTTPGVAMASTGGPLLYRIQRLAGINAKESGPSRLPALFAVALGILCLALNITGIRGQDAPGVNVDLGSSSIRHRTPVVYPEAAAKKGITGTVQLEVKLDDDGNVSDAHVLSGPEELRKTSLASVLNWHFAPDAARATRLVNISFSDQGQQVQVRETDNRLTQGVVGPFVARSFNYQGQAVTVLEQAQNIDRLTRRQQLERDMAKAKVQIAEARNSGAPESALLELAARLQEMQREFEATPLPDNGNLTAYYQSLGQSALKRAELLNGRVLKAINTGTLSESARNDLLARLPVRIGDPLSPVVLKQTETAVHGFDEHLNGEFIATDDGQAELRIIVPGVERR